jgi:hypothetical protein
VISVDIGQPQAYIRPSLFSHPPSARLAGDVGFSFHSKLAVGEILVNPAALLK